MSWQSRIFVTKEVMDRVKPQKGAFMRLQEEPMPVEWRASLPLRLRTIEEKTLGADLDLIVDMVNTVVDVLEPDIKERAVALAAPGQRLEYVTSVGQYHLEQGSWWFTHRRRRGPGFGPYKTFLQALTGTRHLR